MDETKPPRHKRPSPNGRKVLPAAASRAAPDRDDARIAKVIARAGLCSRRDAETWIAAGRVAVNGAVIDSPALNVSPHDRVTVDGLPLPEREATRLFLFHKPRGLVTTAKDPEGRQTIFDALPPDLPRVVSVGRLDINTEGLLLLTNDGGLARTLELPSTGWLRRYRVRANGEIAPPALAGLAAGITVDGVDYAGIEATLDRVQGSNVWLTMGLREGKNREIKRVLEHLGLTVNRLIRLSFGPFQLGELPEGAVEEVRPRVLIDQLGPALAAEVGVTVAPEAPAGRRPRGGDLAEGRRSRSPVQEEPAVPRPSRPKPASRAHVSVLRAARAAEHGGEGRRRIDRGATADRKGRAVTVERVTAAGAATEAPRTRNAHRFAGERNASRTATPGRPDRAGPPKRTEGKRTEGQRTDGQRTGGPRHDGQFPGGQRPGRRPDAPRRDDRQGQQRPTLRDDRRLDRHEAPGETRRPRATSAPDRGAARDPRSADRKPSRAFGDARAGGRDDGFARDASRSREERAAPGGSYAARPSRFGRAGHKKEGGAPIKARAPRDAAAPPRSGRSPGGRDRSSAGNGGRNRPPPGGSKRPPRP